jgi:putative flippase GtrA
VKRIAGGKYAPILRQFLTFGLVGTGGFLVDSATLYLCLAVGANHYTGRALSYLVAATFTWAMNRRFTFRDRRDSSLLREWARFLFANALGGALNYATYALLVSTSPMVYAHPVLGVAAGSIASLGANFIVSRHFVFRSSPARNTVGPRDVD